MDDDPTEKASAVADNHSASTSAAKWTARRTTYALALVAVSVLIAVMPLPWTQWGAFGVIGLFVVTSASGLMAFLPSPAYGVIYSAARGYGPLTATIVGGLGWSLGEMVLFHAGRNVPPAVATWVEGALPYLARWLRRPVLGPCLIFSVTLLPNPLFDVVSILAARLGISAYVYFIPMALARVMRSAGIAWLATVP